MSQQFSHVFPQRAARMLRKPQTLHPCFSQWPSLLRHGIFNFCSSSLRLYIKGVYENYVIGRMPKSHSFWVNICILCLQFSLLASKCLVLCLSAVLGPFEGSWNWTVPWWLFFAKTSSGNSTYPFALSSFAGKYAVPPGHQQPLVLGCSTVLVIPCCLVSAENAKSQCTAPLALPPLARKLFPLLEHWPLLVSTEASDFGERS